MSDVPDSVREAAQAEFRAVFPKLQAGDRPDAAASERLYTGLLSGGLEDAQIGALLALSPPGLVSVEELVGGARAMRAHATRVPVKPEPGTSLIDTCGTGGAPKTFNVSTAAAIIAASTTPPDGRPRCVVAKHGNRSRTGRGSAEVLAALGVNLDATVEQQAACLHACGVCFSFAIRHHPAMRFAAGPRRALGVPTIFNVLGPLTNPAGATRQLIGVFQAGLVEKVACALAELGAERALVVHGGDGLDELTTTTTSIAARVRGGAVTPETVDPAQLGIARADFSALTVESVEASAEVIRSIFAGEHGPRRDIAVLSAAAALTVAETVTTLEEGLARASEAIDRGDAARTLATLAEVSHAPVSGTGDE